jgi:NAD(P)-dependent dehydrogenase (short-subunit alcohol dehydrogenase family)
MRPLLKWHVRRAKRDLGAWTYRLTTPVIEVDVDEWWKTQEIDVKGTFLNSRAFLPLLLNGR